jgi:hypothetical protein
MALTNAGLPNGGSTQSFQINYDPTLPAPNVVALVTQVVNAVESDFALMRSWFGGVKFKFNLPIAVDILNSNIGGAWTDPTDAGLLFYKPNIAIGPTANLTSGYIRFLIVAEVTEMLMASLNNGAWFGNTDILTNADEGSKGEALSRFLAVQFKQTSGLQNMQTPTVVNLWLNAVNRMPQPNPIDTPIDDTKNDATVGCTTAFLFYLYNQLHFNTQKIISAGAASLALVYTNLTGKNDAWQSFTDLVNLHYPQTVTYSIPNDQIFPVSNLSFLSSTEVIAGSSATIGLGLDTLALADIQVNLLSENPAIVSIPTQIRFTPGTNSIAIPANVAPITGPSQVVKVFATYAGTTLSANVTVLPAASVVQGNVIDGSSSPIKGATVLFTSDTVILDGSGNTLQLSTDANGFYQTPAIPPHVYTVQALQSGYVPQQATVPVELGVPVTRVNFTLAATQPFTINGVAKALSGSVLEGVAVILTENSPIPQSTSVKTDASGRYSITMDPGPYNGNFSISASFAGYEAANVTIDSIANGAVIEKDLTLIPLGSLSGTIKDTNGKAVASAQISLGATVTRSNTSGHYSVRGLNPGPVVINVSAAGFDPASVSVTIKPGTNVVENISLRNATAIVTGTVTRADTTDPIQVKVSGGSHSTQTDDLGRYTLTGLPAGACQISVTSQEFRPSQTVVQLIDNQTLTQDFILQPLHWIGPKQ